MPRVFLLTSHPLDGHDGADKVIAAGLTRCLPSVSFSYFGKAGAPPAATGHRIPIASAHSMPGRLERAQVALWTPALTRAADLVHVVMTVGATFAAWTRSPLSPRERPTLLTVPGVLNEVCLSRSRPFDVTVTFSEATARQMRSAGYPDVRVIPPGIDLGRWRPAPLRARPTPVLFFAGHAGPDGGTREAIDAAVHVQRAGTPVHLVLALRVRPGQEEREELVAVSAAAHAAGLRSFEVRGRIDSMREAIADADVVLFIPERLSGGKADIPLTVLEALASGRPVISTRLPQLQALADVVEQVPVRSPVAVANAVRVLLSSPRLWRTRAELGRAAVQERYSDVQMAHAYGQVYAELLTRGRTGTIPVSSTSGRGPRRTWSALRPRVSGRVPASQVAGRTSTTIQHEAAAPGPATRLPADQAGPSPCTPCALDSSARTTGDS